GGGEGVGGGGGGGGGGARLDRAYDPGIKGGRGLGNEGLARPCGPAEGPYADYSLAALVLHINREALHHGAEIALLRDLYRAKVDRGHGQAQGAAVASRTSFRDSRGQIWNPFTA